MTVGRLLVAGKLVVDEVLTCAEPLVPGSAQRATARAITGGGQVWHTARAARYAAASVAVTGWCGLDDDTARLRAELVDLDIADLLVPAGEASRAVVLVGPDGERLIVSSGGAARLSALDHPALLDGTGWLHLDGYALDERSADALVALAAAAYAGGVPVSVEPPSLSALATRRPGLAALPPLAALLGRPDEIDAVLPLLIAPPEVTVAHDGPSAVRTRTADDERVTVVPRGKVVTTGAGDRFAGGWLAARLGGADLDESVESALAAVPLPG